MGRPEDSLGCQSEGIVLPVFSLRQSLSQAWDTSMRLGWLPAHHMALHTSALSSQCAWVLETELMFLCLHNRHLVDRTISQAPDTLLLHAEPHHSRYHSLNLLLLLRPNELGSNRIICFFFKLSLSFFEEMCIWRTEKNYCKISHFRIRDKYFC